MICDLTAAFLKASSTNHLWSKDDFQALCQSVTCHLYAAVIDYDIEAGENWASIIVNDRTIGMIHADLPLIVILIEFEEYIRILLDQKMQELLVVVGISDMERKSYALEKSVIKTIFYGRWSRNIDSNEFSIRELWWATI